VQSRCSSGNHDLVGARCVMVDDVLQRPPPGREKPVWRFLQIDEVHSFEIIDRDHGSAYFAAEMLRIYTKKYIRKMVAEGVDPEPNPSLPRRASPPLPLAPSRTQSRPATGPFSP